MSTPQTKPPAATTALAQLTNLLTKHEDQIKAALPRHMTPERMIRVALSAVGRSYQLGQCTPLSLAASIVQASVLGLEPNTVLGECYLIPFWNKHALRQDGGKGAYEAQMVPGYMGLLKLARNSGEVSTFDAQIVYANDDFEFEKGAYPTWRHKWARRGPRGDMDGAWAGYALKDKTTNFEYWTIEQITEHRDQYSKGAYVMDKGNFVLDGEGRRQLTGAWAESPDWMYKKTVIRQTVKLMPKSTELAMALRLEDSSMAGRPQEIDILPIDPMLPEAQGAQIEGPSEDPPAPTGPQRKSSSASKTTVNTKPADAPTTNETAPDPKTIKVLPATLASINEMKGVLGEAAWWQMIGNAGLTNPGELNNEAEGIMLLGMMQQRAKEVGK